SLLSYFLVTLDSNEEKAVNAGLIYVLMTHIGTAFITAAFLIIYSYSGSFDFILMKEACINLPMNIKTIIFLCFLIGFGTKAGLVPFHIWLPYAHPEAPSHISAVMSGVMIKLGVYGFIRFVLFILGVHQLWWGNLVLVIAAVSCLGGVIYALMEHDIKKLLAYHSVENIGIIMLGVGGYMVFINMQFPLLAVFSLSAALFHVVNHAIFKTLLFLCAGTVLKSCGTKNMEKLGGLIKLMPVTAFCFLIGALAISAMPPLNGFASEWLILQSLLSGALAASAEVFGKMKIFFALLAGALALMGGLAAACFVKAFGVTFLGLPRSKKAGGGKDFGWSMKIPIIFLASLTLFFGIFAAPIFNILTKIASEASGLSNLGVKFTLGALSLSPQNGAFQLNGLMLVFLIFAIAAIVYIIVRIISKERSITYGRTWDCGYYGLTARNQYTATGFSKPLRMAFNFILRPYKKTEKVRDSYYHVKSFKYEIFTKQVIMEYFYSPIIKKLFGFSELIKKIQQGSIHLYIGYIFIAVIFLIIFLKRF
ncbi:MAG: proton-conducting transporter membrane subunit, partial [Candidatus Firestonebacteria bacterium]